MMKRYLYLLSDHGLVNFTSKAIGVVDRSLFGSYFSRRNFRAALKARRPYFGNFLAANQGNFRRHQYMQRLVRSQARLVGLGGSIDVLEVGSYAGASAVVWSHAIRDHHGGHGSVLCIDPWETLFSLDDGTGGILSTMTTSLRDGSIFKLFMHNVNASGSLQLVQYQKAMFHDVAAGLQECGRLFDVVYVDGDHRHNAVFRDLTLGAGLLKPGGVLCGDDLELQMDEVDQVACQLNMDQDFIIDPKTRRFYHPGVCSAVYEFFGSQRVSAWVGFWAMRSTSTGRFECVGL